MDKNLSLDYTKDYSYQDLCDLIGENVELSGKKRELQTKRIKSKYNIRESITKGRKKYYKIMPDLTIDQFITQHMRTPEFTELKEYIEISLYLFFNKLNNKHKQVELSMTEIKQKTALVNENYMFAKINTDMFASMINNYDTHDYLSEVDIITTRLVKDCLHNLENKSLIHIDANSLWCVEEKNGIISKARKANYEENQDWLRISHEYLVDHKIDELGDLTFYEQRELRTLQNAYMKEKYSWAYGFYKYNIYCLYDVIDDFYESRLDIFKSQLNRKINTKIYNSKQGKLKNIKKKSKKELNDILIKQNPNKKYKGRKNDS